MVAIDAELEIAVGLELRLAHGAGPRALHGGERHMALVENLQREDECTA